MDNEGKPRGYEAVHCGAPGCMAESYHAYRNGEPFLRKLGIKKNQTFETFRKIPEALESFNAARDFAEGKAENIFLLVYGGVGCGKSHLCNAVAVSLSERNVPFIFKESDDLLSLLRASIGDGNTEKEIQNIKDTPVFILDDYKPDRDSTWAISRIEEIISYRYNALAMTLVTTNLQSSQLPERIFSRFSEIGTSKKVLNAAPDYRRTG